MAEKPKEPSRHEKKGPDHDKQVPPKDTGVHGPPGRADHRPTRVAELSTTAKSHGYRSSQSRMSRVAP
jgi:hypothetical protein